MKEIITVIGDKYLVDEEKGVVYKNGTLLMPSTYEIVYSNFSEDDIPQFAGIHLKDKNSIVSSTGVINPVVDINSL